MLKSARFRLLAILALVAVPVTSATAETEAETASRTQRSLTEVERARLIQDCKLPGDGTEISGMPNALNAVLVDMPQVDLLPLFTFRTASAAGASDAAIERYEPLPKGGVGRADFCEAAILHTYPPPKATQITRIIGLRLRPGLDLARNYPTAFAEIRRRGQHAEIPAKRYIRVDKFDLKQLPGLTSSLGDRVRLDRTVPIIEINKQTYFALIE